MARQPWFSWIEQTSSLRRVKIDPQAFNPTRIRDRIRGCLLAGAIGDAMGGPFEGQQGPLHFREHSDWKISDDTQLTLATCESIIELGRVSPEHIAARFL